jgi:hypothetical protein
MIEDLVELGNKSSNEILLVVPAEPKKFRQVPKQFANKVKNKDINTN